MYLIKHSYFLDEVHLCPRARQAVINLIAQNKYDVIMATSAYGMNIEHFPIEPQANELLLNLYGLDFEEFLWANSINLNVIEEIRNHYYTRTTVPNVLHETVMGFLREYAVIGGMPKVVEVFTTKHNFKSALKIQKDIIKDYMKQLAFYLKKVDYRKTISCFKSIPRQLEKENKKIHVWYCRRKLKCKKNMKKIF